MISEDGSSSVHGDDRTGTKKSTTPTKKSHKKSSSKSDRKAAKERSKGLSQKEVYVKKKNYEYRSGQANMPVHEVIQDSVHVQTGNIDLQFCDDAPG